jgi:uncharacterized membrane protein YqiK
MSGIGQVLLAIVVIVVVIAVAWVILWRLYQRSTTEVAFVRTGFLGRKVVMNGGAFVIPVLHDATRVNMNTLRLEVSRSNEQSLITRDRLRVDIVAAFYVRVEASVEAVARAATALGAKTLSTDAMRDLLEGKFIAALRQGAAEMTLEALHEDRAAFIAGVREALAATLAANGLELDSVSVTALDQTRREFFNPTNAFDAAGLTRLTAEIEDRRKARNIIEQDSQVAVQQKNLEAERRLLEIQKEEEYARLDQEREIAVRRAQQSAEVAAEQATRKREADAAEIAAGEATARARLASELSVEADRIAKERKVREKEIERARALDVAEVDRRRAIEIAEQEREVAVAESSRGRSEAQAAAELARAEAVKAEEAVMTARDLERAERTRAIDLIVARALAERDQIAKVGAADAAKAAAAHQATAMTRLAEAEAAAERLRAEAAEIRLAIEAAGRRQMNEADNALGEAARDLRLRLAVVERLEGIIRESVKPMERIDGIKIIQVEGLTGAGGGNGRAGGDGGSLADQLVSSALRYRGQAPLVDALLREIGLPGDAASLTRALGSLVSEEEGSPPSHKDTK